MPGPTDTALRLASRRAARYESDYVKGHSYFPERGEQILNEVDKEQLAARIRKGNGFIVRNIATSTWVTEYGYWAQGGQGGLAIAFHDGAICWYPSLSDYSWYYAMRNAASKGKFIHEYIYKKVGYILVSN